MLRVTPIAFAYTDCTTGNAIGNTLLWQLNDRIYLFDILINSITSIQVNYYTKLLPQPKFHKQQEYLGQNNW
jgi:hypothetical protein